MMSDAKTTKSEDDFLVECSDEESYGGCNYSNKSMWHPPTDEVIRLYELLDKNGIIELSWQCPGRRAPTPPPTKVDSWQDKNAKDTEQEQTPTAFDFDDFYGESSGSSSKITPRRPTGRGALKGSGQKRVASFKNVMSDIRRQMKLEQMDKTPAKSAKEKKSTKSTNNSFRT